MVFGWHFCKQGTHRYLCRPIYILKQFHQKGRQNPDKHYPDDVMRIWVFSSGHGLNPCLPACSGGTPAIPSCTAPGRGGDEGSNSRLGLGTGRRLRERNDGRGHVFGAEIRIFLARCRGQIVYSPSEKWQLPLNARRTGSLFWENLLAPIGWRLCC